MRHRASPCRPIERRRSGGPLTGATRAFTRAKTKPYTTYGKKTLTVWAERLREMFDDASVYVFFDNDTNACAPRNAKTLASLVEH